MAAHLATATHRGRVATRNDAARGDVLAAEERRAWSHRMRHTGPDAEERALEAAAMRGDADHEPYWLGILIAGHLGVPADPGEGTAVDDPVPTPPVVSEAPRTGPSAPAARAQRGYVPQPCPRCGRADFRTDVGRAWHLANNPACAARKAA